MDPAAICILVLGKALLIGFLIWRVSRNPKPDYRRIAELERELFAPTYPPLPPAGSGGGSGGPSLWSKPEKNEEEWDRLLRDNDMDDE